MTKGTHTDEPSVVGEEAHIVAEAFGGPRHEDRTDYDYDCYENLILLCRNDHKPADDQFRHYTVEQLQQTKQEHEAWVENQITTADQPVRVVADPTYPIPRMLNLCMTGTQLWRVMQGTHAFHPSWPDNLTEEHDDLIATFLDNVRDWMDVTVFNGTFQVGRDAAKSLNEQIRELNEAGLFVGARRRHCLLTGGIAEPSTWLVFDIELQQIREAEVADDKGQKFWPPEEAASDA